jgi:digeranylgeranylglycerophospholipid reductase
MKCDVLVVGASAAGLMAAISAARCGSSVILLDKNMSGGNHTANTLFEGMATQAKQQIDHCYVRKTLRGMQIISPFGHSVTVSAPGYFIDRKRFDDCHLKIAENEGVILLQDVAKGLETNSGRYKVSTGHGEIDTMVCIDATGVQPLLASQLGLSTMRHPLDIAWAIEATIQHPDLGEEDFFQYWIGSMAPGWKATFSPAGGDKATLGVFVRGHGQNVEPFFNNFIKMFKANKAKTYRNIDRMKIISKIQGGDPIAVLPNEIVSDGFMVTGGAAGQSGLAYGMRAGAICGDVAGRAVAANDVSKASLSKYEKLWWSEFGWVYRMGRASLETLRNMSDKEIDSLTLGLSGKSLVQGGPFHKKVLFAGLKITLVQPKIVFNLASNIVKG